MRKYGKSIGVSKLEIPYSFCLLGTHHTMTFCFIGKPLILNTEVEFCICWVLQLLIVCENVIWLYETINVEDLSIVKHMRLVKPQSLTHKPILVFWTEMTYVIIITLALGRGGTVGLLIRKETLYPMSYKCEMLARKERVDYPIYSSNY